ncbi:MAG: hypothetical protein ACI8RZ_000332 [Myxococcota bacterium]|jgi:hypothetical protein
MPLSLWLLSACTGPDWCERFNLDCEEDSLREEKVDLDEDVWTEDVDCDDTNATIYPYAPELCDNQDNDCDGLDDVAEGLAVWLYRDSDDDGHGDPESTYFHCNSEEKPEGWLELGDDCDDTSPLTNPNAPERCDLEDNDCDGDIDEDVLLTFYIDLDGDGAGTPGKTTEGCTPPDGYGITDQDCDDDDGTRFPAAPEICDNIDNNCNDEIDEAQCSSLIAEAAVLLSGASKEDHAGSALSGAGDLNNDGYDDLLIGAHGVDDAAPDAGAVYVVYGPVTGSIQLADAPIQLLGESTDDQLGHAVADVGDLNGDGYDDVLIGADSSEDGRGTIYLLHGPISASDTLSDAAARITGLSEQDYHGRSVAGLGDVTGDGIPDLGAGAWGSDVGGTNAGAVFIYAGPVSGTLTADDADGTLLGESENDFAGWSLAGVGDTNGDGYDDVLVGAYGIQYGTGGVSLVLGPISGSVSLSEADANLLGGTPGTPGQHVGWSVDGAGDIDGDGLSDILIGSPQRNGAGMSSPGAAWLMYGPVTGNQPLSSAGVSMGGLSSYDQAGFSVSGISDRDGDGLAEILIGAYGTGLDAGSGYLLRSDGVLPLASSMPLSVADWVLRGDVSNAEAGVAVGSAGDVNGDGRGDLLIGAPELGGAGGAYLIY